MRNMRWLLLWTALMALYAWWDHERAVCSWRVHGVTGRVERTVRLKPVRFNNTAVVWMNSVSDEIDLTVVQTLDDTAGDVSIGKMQMHIFNDAERQDLCEITELDADEILSGTWNTTFLQGDVNLSPFRRLLVWPRVDWDLGGDPCPWCPPRAGTFYGGKWIQVRAWWWGRWVLFWSAGAVFLLRKRRTKGRRLRF